MHEYYNIWIYFTSYTSSNSKKWQGKSLLSLHNYPVQMEEENTFR